MNGSLDAERAVLGAVILNPEVLPTITKTLTGDSVDWYTDPLHNIVFNTAVSMQDDRKPIDVVTLHNELRCHPEYDRIEAAGGMAYLAEMSGDVPTTANAKQYAAIVKDAYQKRRLDSLTLSVRADLLAGKKAEDIGETLIRESQSIFENRKRRLIADDIGFMRRNPAPGVDFLFDGLVPLGTLSGCDAAGGSGKGFMTQEIAVSLVIGRTLLPTFRPTRRRKVLWLQAEEPTKIMHNRLKSIADKYNLTDDEWDALEGDLTCYSKQTGNLSKTDDEGQIVGTSLFNDIRDDVRRIQPGMIIIDPRANFFHGNENDNTEVQQFLSLLESLTDEVEEGSTVWINHHASKARQTENGADMGRGASAGRDRMRCLFNLTCLTDKEVKAAGISNPKLFVKLTLSKSNWTSPLDGSIYLRRCTGGVLEEVDFQAMLNKSRNAVSNQLAESLAEMIGDNPKRYSLRDICKGGSDDWKAVRAELKDKHGATVTDIEAAIEYAEKIGLIIIEEEAQRRGSPKRIPRKADR